MLMLAQLWNWLRSDERGQGLAEYGLIILLVALVVIGAVALFGEQIMAIFTNITAQLVPPTP